MLASNFNPDLQTQCFIQNKILDDCFDHFMHILQSYHHHKFNLFISSTHFSGKNVNHNKMDLLLHVFNIRGSTKIALICKATRERGKQRNKETKRNKEKERKKREKHIERWKQRNSETERNRETEKQRKREREKVRQSKQKEREKER